MIRTNSQATPNLQNDIDALDKLFKCIAERGHMIRTQITDSNSSGETLSIEKKSGENSNNSLVSDDAQVNTLVKKKAKK